MALFSCYQRYRASNESSSKVVASSFVRPFEAKSSKSEFGRGRTFTDAASEAKQGKKQQPKLSIDFSSHALHCDAKTAAALQAIDAN